MRSDLSPQAGRGEPSSPTTSFKPSPTPKTWMPGTSPGMAKSMSIDRRSRVLLFKPVVLDDIETGVDQFAAQERQRRIVIEHEVVEGIGDDLGHPDEAGLDVADEE